MDSSVSDLPGVETADWEKSRSKGCMEDTGGSSEGRTAESIAVSEGVELRWPCSSQLFT